VPQALALPQVAHRGLLKTFEHVPGVARSLTVVRTGFKMAGDDPDVTLPPPVLGEHTDEVLASIGYSAAEIDALRERGAI
jgi:crotonobetainyl-CoA:carnitine CoA-transferase CaiB-like acyl-CoA transferase